MGKGPRAMPDETSARPLLSLEFSLLAGISFFAFCNLAVFYGFHAYLGQIGIAPEWRGFLLGLEPFTAFVLRLVLIPLIGVGNATRVLLAGLLLVLVLVSYRWALTVPSLALLRILHGAAFVVLVSACVNLVVRFIPEERSAQGFSLFSLTTLLPYAIMPPLAERLLPWVGGAANLYAGVALLAIPALLLLVWGGPRLEAALSGLDQGLTRRPSRAELVADLREPAVRALLAFNLCFYLSYSAVYYFLKDFGGHLEGHAVGDFFLFSTAMILALRLTSGLVLDRFPKRPFLILATAVLVVTVPSLALATSEAGLEALGLCYGLGVGLALPLLNALLFERSPPALRGVNTNLSLFMMDAGFFLTPWLGGLFLAGGGAVGTLFVANATILALGLGFLTAVRTPTGESSP